MKNMMIVLFSLLALSFYGSETRAAEGIATATILPTISTSKNVESNTGGDLAFGVILPSESSGTVTIAASNSVRTYNGGVALVASTSGAASFNIYGAANTTYTVTLPDTEAVIISSGSNTMTVQSFTVYPPGSVTLDNLGKATFNIGGTLKVEPNQPAGSYTGTFQVTVAYQ